MFRISIFEFRNYFMKIVLERSKCIGCGSCAAVCPRFFEMGEDGLSVVKGGQTVGDNMELEVQNPFCAREAGDICPVQIIHLEK